MNIKRTISKLRQLAAIAGAGVSPIGLDIGSRWVKAVQLERVADPGEGAPRASSGRWRVRAAAGYPRIVEGDVGDEGGEAATELTGRELELLERVLWRQDFRGRRVVVGASHKDVEMHTLELPPVEPEALGEVARSEIVRLRSRGVTAPGSAVAQGHEPVATGGFEFAAWEMPRRSGPRGEGGKRSWLAAAVGHEAAKRRLDSLESIRLRPTALTAGVAALARAADPSVECNGAGEQPDVPLTVVVDAAWSAARVSLVRCGGVVDSRLLEPLGLKTLHANVMEAVDTDAEAADYLLAQHGLVPIGDRRASPREGSIDRRALAPAALAGGVAGCVRIASEVVRNHFEKIAEETRASITYAEHRFTGLGVSGVVLVGGGAEVPGAAALLRGQLDPPVTPWGGSSPATDDSEGPPTGMLSPAFALASGLAMWEGGGP